MSMSKNEELSRRWLQAAADDLETAEWDYKGGFHNQVCFLCQQAVEKALKAFLYARGERDVWGHSTELLCRQCAEYDKELEKRCDSLKKLDRFYIPTRYPNGLPSGTPRENYTVDDSDYARGVAGMIIENVRKNFKEKS